MTVKPKTRLIGIENATISVKRTRRMKKNSTMQASAPPNMPFLTSVPRLSSMTSPWSKKLSTSSPASLGLILSSSTSLPSRAVTSRVLAWDSLITWMATAGAPLSRARYSLSGSS